MALTYEEKKAMMLRARALAPKPYSQMKKRGMKKFTKGATITQARLLRAIPGTSGILTRIGERLGVIRESVQLALHREGWEECLALYHAEMEKVTDLAEETVEDCMKQDESLVVRLKAATWYLEKKDKAQERGYANRQTTTLEGGKTPVRVENMLAVESLPLAVRVAILNAIENGVREEPAGGGNRSAPDAPSGSSGSRVRKLKVKLSA